MHRRLRYTVASALVFMSMLLPVAGSTALGAAQGSKASSPGTLTVFAAASLTGAFTTIGTAFDKADNASVRFNFGGSDQLETQIDQGAPADVFASADQMHMQLAQSKGLIAGTPAVFVHNRLVVIVPKNNPAHIYSLADLGRPGVGLVLAAATVPVGKYARLAFAEMAGDTSFGPSFLARIQSNIKSNEINDTAVVAKVALGEADAGVVYASDLASSQGSQIASIDIPAAFNQLATYPIAATKNSQNAALAKKFVDYVLSPAGQSVLKSAGFIVGGPAGGPSSAVMVSGLVATPITFTVADLQKLPRTTVTVTESGSHDKYTYVGALLNTVIQKAAPIANSSFLNDPLRQFVTVGATNGYQVTVGMAEILPAYGHEKVILAYERNGKPLPAAEGAIRLIVPGDSLDGRWVSHVDSIVVGTPVGSPS